jgi:hypothetical protein
MSDRVLPSELRAQLISKLPFSNEARDEYTPKMFELKNEDGTWKVPEEYRPTFVLRPWTRQEILAVRAACRKEPADEEGIREACRKACTGWKNLFDAGSGKEVDYSGTAGCDRVLWDNIPSTIIEDLFTRCSKISGLMEQEKTSL